MMSHWRTTVIGCALIAGAVITFVARWASSGVAPGAAEWEALGLGVTAGAGFLRTADAKEVNTVKTDVASVKADVKELQ